jgi:hypothetical protein
MRKLRGQRETAKVPPVRPSPYKVFHRSQSITPKSGKLLVECLLLEPLNANPESPLSTTILRVIELVQQAQRLRRSFFREVCRGQSSDGVMVTAGIKKLGEGWKGAVRELNKMAGRYRWRIDLAMLPDSSAFVNTHTPIARSKREAEEAAALALLTQFHDLAERVRRCDECSKWFFADTAWQKYCKTGACRQKHAARSPEFKEKRARYMREKYLPLKKQLKRLAEKRKEGERATLEATREKLMRHPAVKRLDGERREAEAAADTKKATLRKKATR